MKRHYLYGLLGLLSLLGFVGVFTQERVFLAFFAFAVDFTHFFQRTDEMAVAYLNRSAALGFHWGMAATGVVVLLPPGPGEQSSPGHRFGCRLCRGRGGPRSGGALFRHPRALGADL